MCGEQIGEPGARRPSVGSVEIVDVTRIIVITSMESFLPTAEDSFVKWRCDRGAPRFESGFFHVLSEYGAEGGRRLMPGRLKFLHDLPELIFAVHTEPIHVFIGTIVLGLVRRPGAIESPWHYALCMFVL